MKKGFTLAEVLITLGIIGVVAAMTIPNLITAHQKKVTVTKLQRAISILNQAYRLSYEENGDASAQEERIWELCNILTHFGHHTLKPHFFAPVRQPAVIPATNPLKI